MNKKIKKRLDDIEKRLNSLESDVRFRIIEEQDNNTIIRMMTDKPVTYQTKYFTSPMKRPFF